MNKKSKTKVKPYSTKTLETYHYPTDSAMTAVMQTMVIFPHTFEFKYVDWTTNTLEVYVMK